MITISARNFRENQGKVLKQALNGKEIVLTTRDYGSFRIVPVQEEDSIISDAELDQLIDTAMQEHREGRTKKYTIEELKAMAGL